MGISHENFMPLFNIVQLTPEKHKRILKCQRKKSRQTAVVTT